MLEKCDPFFSQSLLSMHYNSQKIKCISLHLYDFLSRILWSQVFVNIWFSLHTQNWVETLCFFYLWPFLFESEGVFTSIKQRPGMRSAGKVTYERWATSASVNWGKHLPIKCFSLLVLVIYIDKPFLSNILLVKIKPMYKLGTPF